MQPSRSIFVRQMQWDASGLERSRLRMDCRGAAGHQGARQGLWVSETVQAIPQAIPVAIQVEPSGVQRDFSCKGRSGMR